MDIGRQVDYWKSSSAEDLAAARSLLEKGHLRHCLFFAHLALEKMLKAHVTYRTRDVAPRTHSLIRLAELGCLNLDGRQAQMLREFGLYQLEGRYPDYGQAAVDSAIAKEELGRAEEMIEWLKKQL